MTNFEKYKDKIIELKNQGLDLAMWDGKLMSCDEISCRGCDFEKNDDCHANVIAWLYEDDGEPSAERKAGQDEAWELARRIYCYGPDGEFDMEDMIDIFGYCNLTRVFCEYSYQEVAEK